MNIGNSIITNIEEKAIKSFLRKNGVSTEKLINNQNLGKLISEELDAEKFDISMLETFLFEELMFGKRKYMRIYRLDDIRNIKYEEDWNKLVNQDIGNSLNFNNIMTVQTSINESKKIAAIQTIYNDKDEIVKISILLVYPIKLKDGSSSNFYIPVEFDLIKKLLIIKAWRRNGVSGEYQYRPSTLMDETSLWLDNNLDYSKENENQNDKETLYNMSKELSYEVFMKIPAYKESDSFFKEINDFSNSVLSNMELECTYKEQGKVCIPNGVMDINDELLKLIQRLTISDYFMNRDYNDVWNMGLKAVVNCVKFNDQENILAILSGENKKNPVFCSKSFLMLFKSIEESKLVNTIWISFKYNDNKVRITYDTSKNDEYLEIAILSDFKYFSRGLFEHIWEVFIEYETSNNPKNEELDQAVII